MPDFGDAHISPAGDAAFLAGDDTSSVANDRTFPDVGAAFPARVAVSSQGDVGASPNSGICDTTPL
jgi:hypothetical protein